MDIGMSFQMPSTRRAVFDQALAAMAEFKHVFGRPLSADFVAELYVAEHLGLDLSEGINQPGYDAISPDGIRYQIKNRALTTSNIDINNFNFDYLVLVNLDENYRLIGMWRITAAQAQEITVFREDFRKHQTTQNKIKAIGERIS